jgi:RES domain-containing protein
MPTVNEELVDKIDELNTTSIEGEFFRYTSARRDPLSGAGARAFGGRWNPKDICSTIYLAQPKNACAGEVDRAAKANNVTAHAMLRASYVLHTVTVKPLQIIDLTVAENLDHVGLTDSDIADDDWSACQAVGHAAWFLGIQGVLAPSASGRGAVLAVYENRIGLGQLAVSQSEAFTPELYDRLQ